MQIINKQFGILETVLCNGIHQFFHRFRFQQQIHKGILKAHEKMALLKDSGSHEAKHQFFTAVYLGRRLKGILPSVAAVCDQIRYLYGFLPFGHIRAYFVGFCNVWHGTGGVLGEEDLSPPLIHRSFASYPVSSGEFL